MRRFLQVTQPARDLGAHRFCRVCSGSGEAEGLLETELLALLSDVCELIGLDLLNNADVVLDELGELVLSS